MCKVILQFCNCCCVSKQKPDPPFQWSSPGSSCPTVQRLTTKYSFPIQINLAKTTVDTAQVFINVRSVQLCFSTYMIFLPISSNTMERVCEGVVGIMDHYRADGVRITHDPFTFTFTFFLFPEYISIMDHYRADGVRITHDPFAPGVAEKYGMPGKTDQ